MPEWSRRDVLRASAGAAALAVPMTALTGGVGAKASGAAAGSAHGPDVDIRPEELASFGREPVLFTVRDAARGEVAILHGTDEVIVQDRQLVARIVRAANSRRAL